MILQIQSQFLSLWQRHCGVLQYSPLHIQVHVGLGVQFQSLHPKVFKTS